MSSPHPEDGVPNPVEFNLADDPFGELIATRESTTQFLEQASMDFQRRMGIVRERRADVQDKATIAGRELGRKLNGVGVDDTINLTENETVTILAYDPKIAEQPIHAAAVREKIQLRLQQLGSGGKENIFDPAKAVTVEEGQRRIAGESQYVALQSAVLEEAFAQVEQGDLSAAIKTCTSVLTLPDVPSWFADGLVAKVINTDLTDRAALEKLAQLPDASHGLDMDRIMKADIANLTVVEAIARRGTEARTQLTEIKKKEKKEQRQGTLEQDTYNAAEQAGRTRFVELIDTTSNNRNVDFADIHITLEGRDDRFPVLLGTMNSNADYRQAIRELSLNGTAGPVAQLRRLQLLTENPQLFESVVGTVASNTRTDWLGNTAEDYTQAGNADGWNDYWRTTLQRTINGYALGMMEAAIDLNQQGPANGLNTLRRDTFTQAYQLLFNELDMLNKSDIPKIIANPLMATARTRLGKYFQSLGSNQEATARFKEFTTGESHLIKRAGEELVAVRERNQRTEVEKLAEKERAKQRQSEYDQQLQAGINTQIEAAQKTLQEIDQLKAGPVETARMKFTAYKEFQDKILSEKYGTWVALDVSDKMGPRLKVNEKTKHSLEQQRQQLESRVQVLEQQTSTTQQAQIEAVRRQLIPIEIKLEFLADLEQRFRGINNRVRPQKRPTLQGGDRGTFDEYSFRAPHESGQIRPRDMQDREKAYQDLFGPEGRRAQVQQRFQTLQQESQSPDTDSARRSSILSQLREINDSSLFGLRRDVTNQGQYNTSTYNKEYTSGLFIANVVRGNLGDRVV